MKMKIYFTISISYDSKEIRHFLVVHEDFIGIIENMKSIKVFINNLQMELLFGIINKKIWKKK
jgi:hypothetical protein